MMDSEGKPCALPQLVGVTGSKLLPPPASQVPLGQHSEEHFSSPEAKAVLMKFREELAALEEEIEIRNKSLDIPYEYMKPSLVENSVAV